MEVLFWSCLLGGVLYAIVTVIFGDLLGTALDGALDFLSADSPWLQPMTLVGGVTAFGGAGVLLTRYTELAIPAILVIAVLGAVLIGIGVYFMYVKPMKDSENSTGYSMTEMGGKIAEVLVPIPATGYGEVLLRVGGAGVTNQIAASFNGQTIEAGARVVVVEVKDDTLFVSRLDLEG
ncbi:NfeD family protein [Paenibacillus sp. IB182496]|uniref:NfeD family protein n=1 Tax=Paenibacillus sabuli TaxID=2772509 RepID=A0A927GS06_9BACL|nr:NfeD family protein [Paenibacillus sabuli]MBD2846209.1 NfeD family protein [Paenibacillus sabuli]